jgi:very-short-patch-repair endonuclease
LDAGLPSALANVPILDKAGRLTGVPDLFDVEAGVAVEYDGADHRSRRRHAADVDRESDFREAGCALVRVVAPNLLRPARLVARFQAERRRALVRASEQSRLATR